jgi:hypothetical protein
VDACHRSQGRQRLAELLRRPFFLLIVLIALQVALEPRDLLYHLRPSLVIQILQPVLTLLLTKSHTINHLLPSIELHVSLQILMTQLLVLLPILYALLIPVLHERHVAL